MVKAENYFKKSDDEKIISDWKELHRRPELEFDLPETVQYVEKELTAMGISITEKYGKGSIVAEIGPENAGKTIGLRADMDALPIEEKNNNDFRSEHAGCMHACGHDAHTAMLLGAARALKRAEEDGALKCRVKLLFQPNEEGNGSGAGMMVDHGVMEGVDLVFGQHVDPTIKTGVIAFCDGPLEAGCCTYDITFHGKSTHATEPTDGNDPLAMAVHAYEGICLMKCRMIGPFEDNIISISSLHAGSAHNIIPDEASMKISVRYYDEKLEARIKESIMKICEDSAAEFGGTVDIEIGEKCPAVILTKEVNDIGRKAASQLVSPEQIIDVERSMGSEDFSFYLTKCPGSFSLLGIRNEEKGFVEQCHNACFRVDEAALPLGSRYLAQIALMME